MLFLIIKISLYPSLIGTRARNIALITALKLSPAMMCIANTFSIDVIHSNQLMLPPEYRKGKRGNIRPTINDKLKIISRAPRPLSEHRANSIKRPLFLTRRETREKIARVASRLFPLSQFFSANPIPSNTQLFSPRQAR